LVNCMVDLARQAGSHPRCFFTQNWYDQKWVKIVWREERGRLGFQWNHQMVAERGHGLGLVCGSPIKQFIDITRG
jgi:hypothetical protein